MKIEEKRFRFLRATGIVLDQMSQRVNMIVQGVNDSKPYKLDWEDVLSEYDKLGVGDLCEFASGYAFGWHAMNGKLSDDVSKQAMYLEIIEGIIKHQENVK
jgi:hypothetical protein